LLRQRFLRCGVAHERHHVFVASLHRQRGLCDLSCDVPSCDLPCDVHMPHSVSDAISCCDCGSCDCGSRRSSRNKKGDDRAVYIPPQRRPAREFR
jgi:hypothetical protein